MHASAANRQALEGIEDESSTTRPIPISAASPANTRSVRSQLRFWKM
ncbi:hypothetical protein PAMC26577_13585 [Caballeronia sordidicola]|uniref:Uncharacterized protein n=1 Tax=Caballeronia sordidicola TaxID=196367 RepID=A0A242MV33_CABSO|nr:hypothetical protein PAMC26577_13585 [Caballeronia sordidicola]